MQNGSTQPTAGTETESGKPQRVSCPSCGRPLFEIEQVEPASASVRIKTKCKAGGCHKFCQVTFNAGRLAIAVL